MGTPSYTRRMRSRLPNGSRPMIGRATCRSTSSTREVTPTLDEKIDRFELSEQPYLALHSIRDDEARIEAVLDELVSRPPDEKLTIEWQEIAEEHAGTSRRRRWSSLEEQRLALDRSFHGPLSVITGAAGTGKSALLAPLIAAIRKYEGMVPIRRSLPTGKAADQLQGLPALTR